MISDRNLILIIIDRFFMEYRLFSLYSQKTKQKIKRLKFAIEYSTIKI